MNLIYPAIFHYEDGGYWFEFPELDGCFTQGDSEFEVVENAKEALEGYIISILTYVSCDISNSGKFVRKNVTLPEWLSRRAEKASINFSQTLQESLFQKLGITPQKTAVV